jgi:hypothetical protein
MVLPQQSQVSRPGHVDQIFASGAIREVFAWASKVWLLSTFLLRGWIKEVLRLLRTIQTVGAIDARAFFSDFLPKRSELRFFDFASGQALLQILISLHNCMTTLPIADIATQFVGFHDEAAQPSISNLASRGGDSKNAPYPR